jgi:hypothetical protein
MTKHREILNFIYIIRESHLVMEKIFLNGSCWNFYRILKSKYPEAKPYYDVNHIITKIDNRFYDITGVVKNNKSYLPFDLKYWKKSVMKQKINFWENYNKSFSIT